MASQLPMIAGNPKRGRTMVTCSVALLLLILVSAAFIAMRRRVAPQKQPPLPLHPSTFVVSISDEYELLLCGGRGSSSATRISG